MTGLIQYLGKAAADGSSPSFQGIITGGSHTIPSEVREQRGIGSHKAFQYSPGLIVPVGTVDFIVQNDTLLALAMRTAGALTEFGIVAGDTIWNAVHKHCLATALSLHAAAGEELTASLSWMTRLATEGSGAQTQTASTESKLLWNAFAITGVSGLTINTVDISLAHRIVPDPVMETPAADEKRFPKFLQDTGQDMLGFNMTLRAQGGASIVADTLAAIASIVLTFKNTDTPAKTLTITLSDCWLSEKNDDLTPAAVATKGLNYLCDDIGITYA